MSRNNPQRPCSLQNLLKEELQYNHHHQLVSHSKSAVCCINLLINKIINTVQYMHTYSNRGASHLLHVCHAIIAMHYMCTCIHVCIYIYTCIYVYITCIHVYMCIHTCLCTMYLR